jgi:hypothetical protein
MEAAGASFKRKSMISVQLTPNSPVAMPTSPNAVRPTAGC